MTRLEKINTLKKYKETLIYMTGYETETEKKAKELVSKEPQKVKVLKKQFYNKNLKVA